MERIYPVTFLVQLGTVQALPQTKNVILEDAFLVAIELLIPPGPSGFTGLRVRSSRQQILPWGNTDWIIADNYRNIFPVNEQIGSKSISVQGYNEDVYDHTFYMRFQIRTLTDNQSSSLITAAGPLASLIQAGFSSDTPLPSGGGGSLSGISSPLPLPPPPRIPNIPAPPE